MPAILLGAIKITGANGNVTFGDVLQISPNSSSKTYTGSGGGNTGDFSQAISLLSFTITSDPDVIDSVSALKG
ncbi:spore germination protein [Paenibacillus hodogayensis]|uniref:Spore germination protein n=1 Tax=Paenibacillus hodogayensis TaxID=279208 RepID=A0ABV5W3M6_9BACL